MANTTFIDDDYLLMEAAKTGQESKVSKMLMSPFNTSAVDNNGRTALHWAAEYGNIQVVYLLINSGFDINALDNKSQSPIHIACNHRRENVATCLISLGCKVNSSDVTGNTPLHRAVHGNMDAVVYMLCDSGAKVSVDNASMWTPLHEAMRVGNVCVAQKLIAQGIDLNTRTQNKMTPFLTAIFYYRISHRGSYLALDEILKLLIDNGSRLSESDGQWTPLSASIAIDNSLISALLLFHGCQIGKPAQYSRSILVETFTRCEPIVTKLLVTAGYQVTLDELDQCSRRIPVFSRAFMKLSYPGIDNGRGRVEVLQWLRRRTSNTLSLSELCRLSIRQAINVASDDTSIIKRIELLPLPPCIRDFIAMQDFIPDITVL